MAYDENPYLSAVSNVDGADNTLANLQKLNALEDLQLNMRQAQYDNPLPSYLNLGQTQSQPSSVQAPDQGGLGLSAQSEPTSWTDILGGVGGALEAFSAGYNGREPLFMKQQQQKQEMQLRRETLRQQLQAQEETARQHDLQLFEKAMASPRASMMMEALAKNPNYRMAKQAGQFHRAMKEQDYSSLNAYKEFIPEEVQDRFVKGELPDHELSTWLDQARLNAKESAKEQAKAEIVKRAMNKPPDQRSAYESQLVEERQTALELKSAETDLKKAQTLKAQREAEQGPHDNSEDNRIHMAFNNGLPWAQGTNETRQAALKFKGQLYPQGKTDVTAGTPLGQLGKAQEFRDPVTGKAAPAWATVSQATGMGMVNIEPAQVQTVSQLQNVDEALKEILAAGSTLTRKATGSGLFDVPAGMLQTPIIELTKRFAGDPNAALLQSAITRITPALSKLGGDTGNVAVEERKMYADSVFSNSDTLGSFIEKVKSIKKATDRTRTSMGFVPDEKTLMRRLAVMGKTDEQIKAIMDERKRMQ